MTDVLFRAATEVIADTMAQHREYRLDDSSPLVTIWRCRGCGEAFPLTTQRAQDSHELHVAAKAAAALGFPEQWPRESGPEVGPDHVG